MYRIGQGIDFHQLAEGRQLWLGGVLIPHTKGAVGHSDADVLLHAICDAMLGALSLGDIGAHFPDTDQTYKEARYISKQGWDGFHAASIRNAMIDACRLVNFKMTLAKLSLFVIADGVDEAEPQIPSLSIFTGVDFRKRESETCRRRKSRRNMKRLKFSYLQSNIECIMLPRRYCSQEPEANEKTAMSPPIAALS